METWQIPKLAWGEWLVTTPATCINKGSERRVCPSNVPLAEASLTDTRDIAQLQYDNATHLCDARDGNLYKFVTIGSQTWMAENLNYAASGSKYYNNDSANYSKYGRLYDWATATASPSICPDGWHIPSDTDWNALMKAVNSSCADNSSCAGAGTKLKSSTDWQRYREIPIGTDEFGFAALPGGFGYSGGFNFAGSRSGWWSANEYEYLATSAYARAMRNDNEDVRRYYDDKSSLLSVRCVRN